MKRCNQKGITLVDIMVGLAIGAVSTLVVAQAFATFESRKRTATASVGAQVSGAIGLYSIERDLRMSGFGLVPEAIGCTLRSTYSGTVQAATTFAPLVITQGVGGRPDTVRLLNTNKAGTSVPIFVTEDHVQNDSRFFVLSSLGAKRGDLMIVWQPGSDCALFEVTDVPADGIQVRHDRPRPWNAPIGASNNFPVAGYNKGAYLFNMGSLLNRSYSVSNGRALVATDFDSSSNSSSAFEVAGEVMSLQAAYGKDTDNNGVVDLWDEITPADNAGWQQVLAVRMAVVTRDAQRERDNVTAALPRWSGTTANGGSVAIRVDMQPDGTLIADWRNFRYKVFETVVPLRNSLWRWG